MLYNPKDYRTNRKAVLELRRRILAETITTSEVLKIGIKRAQLVKWVKEKKLIAILWGGKNRYNRKQLIDLHL